MTIVPSKKGDQRANTKEEPYLIYPVITQVDLKYKETTLALGLTSVKHKQKINCNNLEID